MISYSELLRNIDIVQATVDASAAVLSLSYDSRQVEKGGLFVAIPGYKTDGHRFIAQAAKNGAAAVVLENSAYALPGIPWIQVKDTRRTLGLLAANFYGHPASTMRMIGVTGTNGKTTTSHLLEELLKKQGEIVGLLGTVVNRVHEINLPAERTTPESLDLQRYLDFIRKKGAGYTVMEVSSHALELHRLEGCEFDAAIFTNLSQDHLDFHADMHSYLEAKGKLFAVLGRGNKKGPKYAVLNCDIPEYQFLKGICRVPVYTYGFSENADFRAENVSLYANGAAFLVSYPQGSMKLQLKMTGKFSIYNVLAAFTAAWNEGVKPELIAEVLAEYRGVPGRFELVDCGQDFAVAVDYAHTPDGLENVLTAAREFVKGKIITVFGCGGDRDKTKRPRMGAIASRLSDFCLVTSDNPRGEDPQKIISDILPGMKEYQTPYEVEKERYQAIKKALALAGNGDLVMIAGKGHETYQEIKGCKLPFDDRQVVRELLLEKGEKDEG